MTRNILVAVALVAAGAVDLDAQVDDSPAPPPADTLLRYPSPGSAFLRSVLLPGWGQAEYGAYVRGGIYFAGWTGNWFMNVKNHTRLNEARNRFDRRPEQIRDMLIAGANDPDSMRAVLDTTDLLARELDQDPIAQNLRELIQSREQQREDWIAWSLFWVLASGIDAFVTAHLADFPADIDLEAHQDRTVSLRVAVPFPRRRR